MKVLGSQNYSPPLNNYLPPQSTPKKSLRYQKSPMQQQNFTRSDKKKPMTMNSKRSLACDYPIEDFKQNHHRHKGLEHLDQIRSRMSNQQLHVAPFSSVVNTNGHHKIDQAPKTTIKAYESQNMNQDKKNQQAISPRYEAKKYFEKMIENKLNHMIQNKRKSASFRTNLGPKQVNNRSEKRKQSYHVHETRKNQNFQNHQQKEEKQQQKPLQINKQKSSLSFIIRKKISSNVIESQRNHEKVAKHPTYGIQNIEKTEFIKSRNTQNYNETNSKDTINNSENHTIAKYTYKPMEEQLKKLKERHYDKEMPVKPNHMKGMKSLKVRVNKILKAQEQLFNEMYFGYDKKEDQLEVKKQNDTLQDQNANFSKDQKVETEQQIGKRLITIEEILQNKARQQRKTQAKQENNYHQEQSAAQTSNLANIQQQQNKYNSIQPVVQIRTEQSSLQQTRGQLKWKSYKQTELQNHPQNTQQNRKRISSIRAIKNYYKKLDTEEKSSFISNDVKDFNNNLTAKRKQSAGCLTHKIKWGSSSRRKLDTDRVKVEGNGVEFSVDGIKEEKVKDEIKLTVPMTKKRPVNKVEFLEEQFLKVKNQTTPKANKNLQKIFAQTINSKQFIDCDAIPFYTGSKSLIIFQDPGISMIVNNNNSIHSPTYPIGFAVEGPSQEMANIKNPDLSPVAMVKKRAYDVVEEKEEEGQNPLESLQELYFELKSKKEILPKANDEFAIESLQELCESCFIFFIQSVFYSFFISQMKKKYITNKLIELINQKSLLLLIVITPAYNFLIGISFFCVVLVNFVVDLHSGF